MSDTSPGLPARPPVIVLAGATGDLGGRIARALRGRCAVVRALVRPDTADARRLALRQAGVSTHDADPDDPAALAALCEGAACVVSALNGLEPTMLELQGRLLDAAISAGVPRFMPSDFSLDFTRTRPGDNRNMDLRRRFMARIDQAPIRASSVLNGAFAELLTGGAPIILPRIRRVVFWGDADQPFDFTAKDDVAGVAAAVALDPDAPRFVRVAGDVVSARDLAVLMSRLGGRHYRLLRAGGLGLLGGVIATTRALTPRSDAPFPAWQGMQYLRDMASGRGRLDPLDNDRFPGMRWTRVERLLSTLA